MKKLHPGVKVSWRISAYIGFIIFAFFLVVSIFAVLLAIGFGFYKILITFIVLLILWIIFIEVWIQLSYDRWFYEFTPDNLKIESGVIFKRYSNVPYQRVQNVDIRRGIIARMLGFSAVNIQTAGYSAGGKGFAAEGYIPAVDVKEAEKIRDFLMKKISKRSRLQGL
ncbi:MAG: PH domain-containing protein [Candidatus Pacearchaeota archaeon]|nr:PH domain-containing protein [Candidatus Pacearchaeota archaeon]